MGRRLQVLLEEPEMTAIRRAARAQQLSVSEWVRRALRAARRETPRADAGRKLEVVRATAWHAFPTGDIDQMLSEIEQGYRSGAKA